MISLEKSYPGYDISGEIVPIHVGYDFSWVRFLLGTISPDTEYSMYCMNHICAKYKIPS